MTENKSFPPAQQHPEAQRGTLLHQHSAEQPEGRPSAAAQPAAVDQPPPLESLAAVSSVANRSDDSAADPHRTSDFVPAPAPEPDPLALRAGSVLAGRYVLEKLLGEGGMGSVWTAQQTEPVKRTVALKLIKPGMDSKAILARFDAERQALALMDHPNIARIYDGGVTPGGQPFFVMELVQGQPFNQYCDAQRLSIDARLQLFVPVCQAVQHAHQKGIIHRDLKPGNVLVTEVDGRPVPKVIDFGLAKAMEQRLTDLSLSETGAIVGTPAYMSPEQADPNTIDIDTRTDVYALGVMLYELLTGSLPIDPKQLKRGAILEMLRLVREVEPPRPSTKLSTAAELPNIAANRSIEPGKLTRLLRGELDWVVMKCLEKDRIRRYETANGLARDIQRYLANEVVEARPPSAGYRLKKFVRRNRVAVIAASLVFLALVVGMIGTTIGFVRAAQAAEQERQARLEADAERQKAELERQKAEAAAEKERLAKEAETRERKYAQAIAAFVKEDFLALTSVEGQDRFGGTGLDRNATLLDLLNRGAGKLRERKDLDPRIEAELSWIIGVNYRGAGEAAKGVPFLERAVVLRRQVLGEEHEETLNAMNSLAVGYAAAGQLAQALPLDEETLKLRKAKLGPDHPATLTSMNNLAEGYAAAGQLEKALPLKEETLKLCKAKLGADHPDTLRSMGNLALGYQDAGQLDKALPLYEETLKRMKAKLGPDHPDTLTSMNNLASAYQDAGQLEKALPLYEETLRLMKAKLGPDHPATLGSLNNLAGGYQDAGQLEKALPLYEETLKLTKAKLGPDHPDTLASMNNLALGYRAAGQLDQALPLLEEAARGVEKRRFQHQHARLIIPDTIKAYEQARQFEQATSWRRKWLAHVKAAAGADSPAYAGELAALGLSLLQQQKWTEAETILRECLAIREKKEPDDWRTFNTQSMLGGALLGQKNYAAAEPLLLKGYEGMKAREKTIPDDVLTERLTQALDRLIALYAALDKPEEAKKWQAAKDQLSASPPKPPAPPPRKP